MSTEAELKEQERRIKELKDKIRRERDAAPLPTFHNIPKRIIEELEIRPALSRFAPLYAKNYKIVNYAFVCGVLGTIVNYIFYHSMLNFMWEPVAFYIGIGGGAVSNYLLTVGPYGYLFMLSDKETQN